jgi:hypothetical protein
VPDRGTYMYQHIHACPCAAVPDDQAAPKLPTLRARQASQRRCSWLSRRGGGEGGASVDRAGVPRQSSDSRQLGQFCQSEAGGGGAVGLGLDRDSINRPRGWRSDRRCSLVSFFSTEGAGGGRRPCTQIPRVCRAKAQTAAQSVESVLSVRSRWASWPQLSAHRVPPRRARAHAKQEAAEEAPYVRGRSRCGIVRRFRTGHAWAVRQLRHAN